jgi:general secretion pathway protein M
MSTMSAPAKLVTSSPLLATVAYAGLVIVLLFIVVTSISDVIDQRSEVAASATMLEQLEGHHAAARQNAAGEAGMPAGSAYLEGATVTIAGATLLQRVASAVAKVGGNVLSTQLDVQSPSSKPGFLSMIASCEIEEPELQKLLYDLEAGMPFLFIDQLVIQTPTGSSGSQGRKLRILLGVSGQWRGAK